MPGGAVLCPRLAADTSCLFVPGLMRSSPAALPTSGPFFSMPAPCRAGPAGRPSCVLRVSVCVCIVYTAGGRTCSDHLTSTWGCLRTPDDERTSPKMVFPEICKIELLSPHRPARTVPAELARPVCPKWWAAIRCLSPSQATLRCRPSVRPSHRTWLLLLALPSDL